MVNDHRSTTGGLAGAPGGSCAGDGQRRGSGQIAGPALPQEAAPTTGELSLEEEAQALEVFGDAAGAAEAYWELLCTTGIDHGLIGPREVPRMWSRHVLNCAVIQELVPQGAQVMDVGSGAGLPGIPLALARPDVQVTLVEPLQRRCRWLEHTIDQLGVSVEVANCRAEELHGQARADVVVSRAVAPLGKLLRWSVPLVQPPGVVLAIKGQSAPEEVEKSRKTFKALKLCDVTVRTVGVEILPTPTTVVHAPVS